MTFKDADSVGDPQSSAPAPPRSPKLTATWYIQQQDQLDNSRELVARLVDRWNDHLFGADLTADQATELEAAIVMLEQHYELDSSRHGALHNLQQQIEEAAPVAGRRAANEARKLVITHIRDHGPVSTQDVCQALNMGDGYVRPTLQLLAAIGVIQREDAARPTQWTYLAEPSSTPRTPVTRGRILGEISLRGRVSQRELCQALAVIGPTMSTATRQLLDSGRIACVGYDDRSPIYEVVPPSMELLLDVLAEAYIALLYDLASQASRSDAASSFEQLAGQLSLDSRRRNTHWRSVLNELQEQALSSADRKACHLLEVLLESAYHLPPEDALDCLQHLSQRAAAAIPPLVEVEDEDTLDELSDPEVAALLRDRLYWASTLSPTQAALAIERIIVQASRYAAAFA